MSNPTVLRSFHSADGSSSYVLLKSTLGGVTSSTVLKLDAESNVQWEKTFTDNTDRYSLDFSKSEDSLVIALLSATDCQLLKMNATDGSIINQIKINGVTL
jgi:hypothetical protein